MMKTFQIQKAAQVSAIAAAITDTFYVKNIYHFKTVQHNTSGLCKRCQK